MVRESVTIVAGIVLDEQSSLSLDELARACEVRAEWILELVEEGVIEPARRERNNWYFEGASLARARIAARLRRDLDVNLSGIALALDLIEEIEALRTRLHALGALP